MAASRNAKRLVRDQQRVIDAVQVIATSTSVLIHGAY